MPLPPCAACHEAVGGPVCVGCGALQPLPADLDPWTALGIRPQWMLAADAIDRAWKEQSKKVHPDRFVGQPPAIRRAALAWTAAVNEARRTLRDRLSRGLLLATGRPTLPERGGPALDPDFLEWVFDQNAALDQHARDIAASHPLAGAATATAADALAAPAAPADGHTLLVAEPAPAAYQAGPQPSAPSPAHPLIAARAQALIASLDAIFARWASDGAPSPQDPVRAEAAHLLAQLRYVEQLQARAQQTGD